MAQHDDGPVDDVGMPRRRRSFTPEFRSKAAHMVINGHRPVAEVAHELDVNKNLLHTWVRDERWHMNKARGTDDKWTQSLGAQPLSMQERAELTRLRASVALQAKEIAFLEDALVYFAAATSKARQLGADAAECACRDMIRRAELPGESP